MKQGLRHRVWRQLKARKSSMVGFFIIMILMFIAVFAPLIANNKPYIYITESKTYFPIFFDYTELRNKDLRKDEFKGFKLFPPIQYTASEYDLNYVVSPPSDAHIFGTDEQGRDIAARMIHGTTISILIGFVAVSIYVFIGIIIGALAGYYGGVVDIVLSRIIEIVMCIPTFFLILTILALRGPSLMAIMIVIGITSWTGIARLVRGEFLKLREADFVSASRALGARNNSIIFRQILPNAMAPVLVSATFGIASTILTESTLSFLGLGVQAPTPSWGQILSQSRSFIDFAWWLTLLPGMAIFITITAYNLVGDALRDAMDPKSVNK